jgi:hypothetical protein
MLLLFAILVFFSCCVKIPCEPHLQGVVRYIWNNWNIQVLCF